MNIIVAILLFITTSILAQTDDQLINESTKLNEQSLLDKYNIIESVWFEKNCMSLAQTMGFNKISQCKLFDSQHINAYVLANGHVYFSLAMMQQIKNTHQWASILAHENAHLELGHYLKTLKKLQKPGLFFPKSKIKKLLRKHEEQADIWAEKRLDEYGFDSGQITFFLQRVIKKTRENKTTNKTNSHLKPSKRAINNKNKEIINHEVIAETENLVFKTSQPQ